MGFFDSVHAGYESWFGPTTSYPSRRITEDLREIADGYDDAGDRKTAMSYRETARKSFADLLKAEAKGER